MSEERTEVEPSDRSPRASPGGEAVRVGTGEAAPSTTRPQPTLPEAPPALDATQLNPPDPDVAATARQSDSDRTESKQRSQLVFSVPGYAALRHLGTGTYGVVWLAEHLKSKKKVAVKFFTSGATQDWQILQAEVKQLAALHADPGIVELIDADLEAREPYFVMRYCEGGSLAERLAKGPLSVAEALPIFVQICQALAYVHVKGIRHCDLKPGNVLLDARGRALLADFGQAHLSDDATPALGTFFYMAPEQADLTRQIADTRWDVYGLGALLYAMLTGKPPRDDGTLRSVLAKTVRLAHRLELYRGKIAGAAPLTGHRRVKGIDRDLIAIVDRCLHVDPNRRPRDAGEVLQLLQRRDRRRRQRPVVVAAVLAPVLLVLLMFGSIYLLFESACDHVREEEHKHAEQVLERNSFIAQLVAEEVRDRVEERIRLLKTAVETTPQLPGLLRAAQSADAKVEHAGLNLWLEEVGKKKPPANQGATYWDYLWITRPDGRIAAMRCWDGKDDFASVAGKDYRYRDWFHGGGETAPTEPKPMLDVTYVSEPYVSTVKGKPLVFAISVPVRDPKAAAGAEPVGLLTLSVGIDRLSRWFQKLMVGDSMAVLFNRRGQYLLHKATEKIKPQVGDRASLELARDLPPKMALFAGSPSGVVETPFRDPLIPEQRYTAAYAAVRSSDRVLNWGLAIQTESEDESAAIRQMRETFRTTAIIGGIAVGVLLPLLWTWLLSVLRRQGRMAHA